ncbi:MAG: hypothetical protein ACRC6V_17265 [Bacteroidales bacterium]
MNKKISEIDAELELMKLCALLEQKGLIRVLQNGVSSERYHYIPLAQVIEISSHEKRGICSIKLANNHKEKIISLSKEELIFDSEQCELAKIIFNLFFINVGKRYINTFIIINSESRNYTVRQMREEMKRVGFGVYSQYAAKCVVSLINRIKRDIIENNENWHKYRLHLRMWLKRSRCQDNNKIYHSTSMRQREKDK